MVVGRPIAKPMARALVCAWLVAGCLAGASAERLPVFASTSEDFIHRMIRTDRAFTEAHDPARDKADFEAAWTAVNEHYPYLAFKGIDWDSIHDALLPRAEAARFSFLHNGIVAGDGRVFCLDKLPEPVEESAENLRTNLEEGTASAEDLSQLYFAF